MTIMKDFLDPNGKNTLFEIEVAKGRDISAYSKFANEQEVVLLPRARFRVTSHQLVLENIPVIHLPQIKPRSNALL